jgi:hypothetical protein
MNLCSIERAAYSVHSLPRLRGRDREGACKEMKRARKKIHAQMLTPSPALQPKSDVSDFGQLITRPNSGKPEFGCKRGRGQTEFAARITPAAAAEPRLP